MVSPPPLKRQAGGSLGPTPQPRAHNLFFKHPVKLKLMVYIMHYKRDIEFSEGEHNFVIIFLKSCEGSTLTGAPKVLVL